MSHQVAVVLREWLPYVLHNVEVYVSSADIQPGARWSNDIANWLDNTDFGILCLTADNVNAPWMNFEAGALSKSVEEARVVPLLINLSSTDIPPGPLTQFQAITPTEEKVLQLVQGMNDLSGTVPPQILEETVRVFWPKLEAKLNAILEQTPDVSEADKPKRSTDNLLAEMLEITRGLQREVHMLKDSRAPGISSPISSPDLPDWLRDVHTRPEGSLRVEHPEYGQGRLLDIMQSNRGIIRLRIRFYNDGTRFVAPSKVRLADTSETDIVEDE
jgi:hypothetical protein